MWQLVSKPVNLSGLEVALLTATDRDCKTLRMRNIYAFIFVSAVIKFTYLGH